MCSCVGSCLGGCCATVVGKACCGKTTETKMGHLILLFLGTVLALVLRYWGGPLMIHLYIYNLDVCTGTGCYGIGAVYRISVALFIFFLLHALVLRFNGGCLRKPSMLANWAVKFLLLILLLVCAFLVPDGFYLGYVNVARVIAGVFLVLQIILLIDFAYRWNENWMADDKEWTKAIIAVCVISFAGCLTWFGFMVHWFGGSGCNLENFLLSGTFLLPMLFTCLSVTSWCEHGALLTSAVVTTYCYWLGFSALSSDPSTCNTLSSHSNENLHLVLGLLIAALTVTYAGYSLSNQQLMGGELHEDKTESLEPDKDAEKQSKDDKQVQEAAKEKEQDEKAEAEEETATASSEEAKVASKFHFFMACSACYMAMLLTSWGANEYDAHSPTKAYDIDTENMWIKVVTQWVTAVLYIWTLVAPYMFPDREFA